MDVLRIVLAWIAFAVFHSVTASERYERAARGVMGDAAFAAYHRLLFTAYTAAAAVLLFLYLRSLPDAPLYQLGTAPRLLFHAVQAAGVLLILWTPFDLAEFVGIRQWRERRNGSAAQERQSARLFTSKAYSIVRHPLYLGISLVVAFVPAHTRTSFTSAVMIVAYFYAGSFFEEAQLVRTFGQAYRDYQNSVPRFLPIRFPR